MSLTIKRSEKESAKLLPKELFLKIFDYLDYDDLLMIPKANEEWTGLIMDLIGKKKVVLNQSESEEYELSYAKRDYLITKSSFRFKMNPTFLLQIRQLIIYHPITLFNLIDLDNLKVLTIETNLYTRISNPMIIRLKYLKKLSMHLYSQQSFNIVLESENLLHLKTNTNLGYFSIIHPHSITRLEARNSDELMKKFSNVESLFVDFLKTDNLFERCNSIEFLYFSNHSQYTTNFREVLASRIQANENLKVFFRGIAFQSIPLETDFAQLNSFSKFLNDESLKIYLKYAQSIWYLNQTVLSIEKFEILTSNIIEKLLHLEDLRILGEIDLNDQDKWIELLGMLKKPGKMYIKSSKLIDPELLDLIPTYTSLVYLKLDKFDPNKIDWILELRYLREFETQMTDLNLLKCLIKKLGYLQKMKFFEQFEVSMKKDIVECYTNRKIALRESKDVFFETIDTIKYWNDIFNCLEISYYLDDHDW